MEKGKLIVIEGAGDGIGKTTQVSLLTERYAAAGVPLYHHHFPSYGTVQGAPVEEYLRGAYGDPKTLSPYFVNGLYALDRAVTFRTLLKDKLDSGMTVLLDRYVTSSLIYQSAMMESDAEKREFVRYVTEYEYGRLGIPEPDRVVFLHVPPEVSARLRAARNGGEADAHEADGEFMRRVYENSLFMAELLRWSVVECAPGGTMRAPEDISREIAALAGPEVAL